MDMQGMSSQAHMAPPVMLPRVERDNRAPLEHFERLLKQGFYKPDLQAMRIALGTIQAHRLDLGDPASLFVVAPPGCGKTTMSIMGSSDLPEVQMIGDLTENIFLSGFYGHAQPGLLEKLGPARQDVEVARGLRPQRKLSLGSLSASENLRICCKRSRSRRSSLTAEQRRFALRSSRIIPPRPTLFRPQEELIRAHSSLLDGSELAKYGSW